MAAKKPTTVVPFLLVMAFMAMLLIWDDDVRRWALVSLALVAALWIIKVTIDLANMRFYPEPMDRTLLSMDPEAPLVLYLRPFAMDAHIVVRNPRYIEHPLGGPAVDEPKAIELENILADAVQSTGPIMHVIGGSPPGMVHLRPSDDEWRDEFLKLAGQAAGIIVLVMPGQEIPWEIKTLKENGWLEKTVFLMAPERIDSQMRFIDELEWSRRMEALGFELPKRDTSFRFVHLNEHGQMRTIGRVEEPDENFIVRAITDVFLPTTYRPDFKKPRPFALFDNKP